MDFSNDPTAYVFYSMFNAIFSYFLLYFVTLSCVMKLTVALKGSLQRNWSMRVVAQLIEKIRESFQSKQTWRMTMRCQSKGS